MVQQERNAKLKAGFFKLSMFFIVPENLQYTCPIFGDCEIDESTRKDCDSCRYNKCLSVGMKKPSGSERRESGKKTKKDGKIKDEIPGKIKGRQRSTDMKDRKTTEPAQDTMESRHGEVPNVSKEAMPGKRRGRPKSSDVKEERTTDGATGDMVELKSEDGQILTKIKERRRSSYVEKERKTEIEPVDTAESYRNDAASMTMKRRSGKKPKKDDKLKKDTAGKIKEHRRSSGFKDSSEDLSNVGSENPTIDSSATLSTKRRGRPPRNVKDKSQSKVSEDESNKPTDTIKQRILAQEKQDESRRKLEIKMSSEDEVKPRGHKRRMIESDTEEENTEETQEEKIRDTSRETRSKRRRNETPEPMESRRTRARGRRNSQESGGQSEGRSEERVTRRTRQSKASDLDSSIPSPGPVPLSDSKWDDLASDSSETVQKKRHGRPPKSSREKLRSDVSDIDSHVPSPAPSCDDELKQAPNEPLAAVPSESNERRLRSSNVISNIFRAISPVNTENENFDDDPQIAEMAEDLTYDYSDGVPKRKRGRPPKNTVESTSNAQSDQEKSPQEKSCENIFQSISPVNTEIENFDDETQIAEMAEDLVINPSDGLPKKKRGRPFKNTPKSTPQQRGKEKTTRDKSNEKRSPKDKSEEWKKVASITEQNDVYNKIFDSGIETKLSSESKLYESARVYKGKTPAEKNHETRKLRNRSAEKEKVATINEQNDVYNKIFDSGIELKSSSGTKPEEPKSSDVAETPKPQKSKIDGKKRVARHEDSGIESKSSPESKLDESPENKLDESGGSIAKETPTTRKSKSGWKKRRVSSEGEPETLTTHKTASPEPESKAHESSSAVGGEISKPEKTKTGRKKKSARFEEEPSTPAPRKTPSPELGVTASGRRRRKAAAK